VTGGTAKIITVGFDTSPFPIIGFGAWLDKNMDEMRQIRGRRISMVFQNPVSFLNPFFTVGEQVAEVIRLHQGIRGKLEIDRRVAELFEKVGIPDASRRIS
jgi:ABC-type dipeptide/oligopeptide/nickel transport system ATPase component